ncbi:DUF4062 domain-containing protein [Cytobacillus depressus]|uniref:DUF4062 domain-containing protein n=1 Tax=Cytobacillus depressus TaxID=1602942 RepID=A0A6L3V319_9BACI|nr:DUF4062 domain-containing protein [Cytobacillus depressus]KAB2328771.1 DUF4062 domain-containing protein [Cytobacillus depressus]
MDFHQLAINGLLGTPSIRNSAFEEIKRMGHEPIRFEDSMRYIHEDSIQTCLEYVSKSDIFLLFIANKGGTIVVDERKSVTHLEFLRAYYEKKRLIVYVYDQVLDTYFQQVRYQILKALKAFIHEHGKEPDSMFDFINECVNGQLLNDIDPYVWYFLYDAEQKGVYFERCSIGTEVVSNIAAYLSSLFKESLQYLNIRPEIEQSLEYVNVYGDYYEKSLELVSLFHKGQITNWRSFLAILRSQMCGFNILTTRTKYQQESAGAIMDSNALTVYERISDQMICKEYDGIATPDNFSLDDLTSYVVQTYHDHENNEKLYYSLEKKTCYFLFKAGPYVFCFHLPLLGGWDPYKLQTFQDYIFNAILESKGYTYCSYIKKLIGGLINE